MTDQIITLDSTEVATYRKNIAGWVSRDGKFYGINEDAARLQGSTHYLCAGCGVAYPKGMASICSYCVGEAISRHSNLPHMEWTDEPCVYSHLLENWFFSKEELFEAALDFSSDIPILSLEWLRCVFPDRVKIKQISAPDLLEDYQDADCNIEVTDELQKAVDAVNTELRKIADQNPLYHSYGNVAVDWSNEEACKSLSDLTAETMAKSDRGEEIVECDSVGEIFGKLEI